MTQKVLRGLIESNNIIRRVQIHNMSSPLSQTGSPPVFPTQSNLFGAPATNQGGFNLTWIVGAGLSIVVILLLVNSLGLTKKVKKSAKGSNNLNYKY